MKGKLLGASIFMSLTTFANAVPNFWDIGFEKGYEVYKINDNKGNTLWIHCASGTGETGDHGAYVTNAKRPMYETAYKNTISTRPLTFLIDQKTLTTPPAVTKTSHTSTEWNDFTKKISNAHHIEAYWNDVKIATFMPRNPNESIVLQDCISKFEEL